MLFRSTFYNLYEARCDSIALSKKSEFSSVLSTKFNESTAVFTADGNTVYFTRNNYINKKVGMDSDNAILLKILKSTKDANGRWSKPVELPFNSNVYSVAHPALSPDEKYLYFASNMRGSRGASDIFRVEILSGGGYGKPENLGENVKTINIIFTHTSRTIRGQKAHTRVAVYHITKIVIRTIGRATNIHRLT